MFVKGEQGDVSVEKSESKKSFLGFMGRHFLDLLFYGVLAAGTVVTMTVMSFSSTPLKVQMLLLPIAVFEAIFFGFETRRIYKNIKSFMESGLAL